MSSAETEQEASPSRGYRASPIAIRNLEITVAVIGEKIDQLLQDRSAVKDLDDRLHVLELAQARAETWGKVAGIIFTIALTVLGTGVFFK
ncbi:MAG: hypothetical protein AB1698_01715 [Pseudomonadota bacterium]